MAITNFRSNYYFLSNFFPQTMVIDGITYPTMEHYFQAQKTLDEEKRRAIAAMPTPSEAKRAGRFVTLRPDWEDVKDEIMLKGLRIKFSSSTLRQALLDTGLESLIEGNTWHDNYWGSCTCDKCCNVGRNQLGILLMQVRREARENDEICAE